MTRINVVPVEELCDQHLLAEHRELTRIPNCIVKGRFNMKDQPSQYTLGKGHVKFFYDKLQYLNRRYHDLSDECISRGFNVSSKWPEEVSHMSGMWNDYEPTENALQLNRDRIQERMCNFVPRYNGKEI